jgi:hypothetical protein
VSCPPIRAVIRVRLAAFSDPDSAADLDRAVWRFRPSGAGGWVLPEGGGGVEVFSRAAHGVEGRHSTPERVLHGNFRLPCANLLKAEQLRKKSRRQGAVEQPEVSAGELVDF